MERSRKINSCKLSENGGDKKYSKISVLLVDGEDRQTLPLAKAFHNLGCTVVTINKSRLDNGYTSRYVKYRILCKKIPNDKNFHMALIKKIIDSGKIDLVVSTSDDTAEQLSLIKEKLSTKTKIAVVEPELFYLAYDKNVTMKLCMEMGIPCPKTFFNVFRIDDLLFEEIQYPIVVKPRKSFGAIGYHRVNSKEELENIFKWIGDEAEKYVFQEYIPQTDIQYECAMFVDENNNVKTACVFSKNRWFPVNGGSSTCNITLENKDIVDNCTRLLKAINWHGVADIDLIRDPRDGQIKILEINPRVSGSVKIVLDSGVNIAEQIIQLAFGEKVSAYLEYKKDIRLRCIHTDVLWFLKSPNRFKTSPSWFSWKNTHDQIWSFDDPVPFFTFSIQAIWKYKKEMEKRIG